MHLHWHRKDLRVADNRALEAGARDSQVVPAFVFDPAVLEFGSPNRVAFMRDALAALREDYRTLDSDLLIARGTPREVIPRLANKYDVASVGWNVDYSGLATVRDNAVQSELESAGLDVSTHHDALLHEPDTITTNEGNHYSVFSYFWRKWIDRPKHDPTEVPDADALKEGVNESELPTLDTLGFARPDAAIPDAGTEAARTRLADFCAGPIYEYAEQRDFPAVDATSRLSVDLSFGTIGIREVFARTEKAAETAPDETAAESVEAFQRQLAWREFYTHVLAARPDTVQKNFRSYEQRIEWRYDPDEFDAWKNGQTGYPIVDAAMRQLRAEGWMHNRVRMIVASFLTKDLLIDWRTGYDWFRENLVDHDTANDVGGWQWAASTGTDAQPYFRIFNPMTQGKRYDPGGEYVTRFIPELRGVPATKVHRWHELDDETREQVAPDYPAPMVDHGDRRDEALATFQRARGG